MQESIEATATETPTHAAGVRSPLAAAAFAAMVGMLLLCADTESLAQETDTAREADGPMVAGFRSARFGMSKSETLDAMQRDFQLARTDIVEQLNDEDRTSSLMATVANIFPGSGPARVIYIHGYKQERLIQVNVLWGLPATGEPDPQELVRTANLLRKHFSQLGFDPENTVMNRRIDDSIIVVFRATDRQERMVLLQLISEKVPAAETEGEEKTEPQNQVSSLWLSYIEDIKDPDVFRIEKGTF